MQNFYNKNLIKIDNVRTQRNSANVNNINVNNKKSLKDDLLCAYYKLSKNIIIFMNINLMRI